MHKYEELSPDSRVWIYQSNRIFEDQEVSEIDAILADFCSQWAAHGQELKAFGKVYFNIFVVLMVDESQAGASGCSIDSSVGVVRKLMDQYKVDLLDRMIFSYRKADDIELVNRTDFEKLFASGDITNSTIVFNNLVKNKSEFESQWQIALEESWHKQMV